MKIKFVGLVAHVTLNGGTAFETQIAALPAAQDHLATLSVPTPLIDDDPDHIGHDVNNISCFPLSGCLTFPNLAPGPAAQQLIAELPSLSKVTSAGNLSPELTNCPPDPAVFFSVVHLPRGGRLMPEDFFKYEVDFNGIAHGPLPHTMVYLVATTGQEVLYIGPHRVVLKAGTDILIANVCDRNVNYNHFQNYKLVFAPPATTVFDPDDSKQRLCSFYTPPEDLPECAQGADLEVDCSNSHFP